jgi:hypothetical protein
MKPMKHIAITIFIAIGIFCTVWYSSCSKDACMGVTCLNFGTCSGGSCMCDTGTGGNNCEVVYRNIYASAGAYSGVSSFNFSTSDTAFADKNHTDSSNTLVFSYGSDTTFDKMQVVWKDSSASVSLPILLSNNTSSGSDFTVTGPVTVGSYSYTGYGTVSSTAASLTLTAHPTNGGQPIIINLNNLTP